MIRKHFFNFTDAITIKDKIMLTSNNSNYDIFLSNGDFGQIRDILSDTEHKQITLKRRNEETKIVEKLQVDLYFRDVKILFKSEDDKLVLIKCKIIENLLFSEQPSLSSDENKAIYLDFVMRNSHLKPNTKEFKDAIKSDPYFNALKIKFGYAITCHKAQGSEWKNVFLNCKSHQSYLSEGYFRWLYTALTRTKSKVYTLDEPHIGLFKIGISEQSSNNNVKISAPIQEEIINTNNTFNIQDKFLLSIFENITQKIESHNINIIDIQHKQYQEIYTFESNNERARVGVFYNGKNMITTINPVDTSNLVLLLKLILEPLKKHLLTVETHTNFNFSEPFLEEFYSHIKEKVENIGVQISNIEHLSWMERYTFVRNKEIEIIDFYYNKKGQPTPSKLVNNSLLTNDILGAL